MTQIGKLLSDLIALPSVNPALLPVRDPRTGEQRVAEFLAARAVREKLDVEFQPVVTNRNNLMLRLQPTGKVQCRVVLAPHLDTVGASGPDTELSTPRIRAGRIYGRGACDTKGSVAAMFEALCQVARSRQRPVHTEIIFVGLVDEEWAQAGSRALVASGFKADLAIVGEPTRLQVVTSHKGLLWMQLKTRGKAAHGARPELGQNAIELMARVIEVLRTKYTAKLRRRRHKLLGNASLNVGCIEGGLQPNIVPAECEIGIDRRTLPGEPDAEVLRELKRLLLSQGLPVSLSRARRESCWPLETDASLPLVRQLLECCRQKKPAGVDYFSDAGVLAHGGIPSVVFGPGNIAQAHTANEWISIKQLERGRDLLIQYLKSLP